MWGSKSTIYSITPLYFKKIWTFVHLVSLYLNTFMTALRTLWIASGGIFRPRSSSRLDLLIPLTAFLASSTMGFTPANSPSTLDLDPCILPSSSYKNRYNYSVSVLRSAASYMALEIYCNAWSACYYFNANSFFLSWASEVNVSTNSLASTNFFKPMYRCLDYEPRDEFFLLKISL